MRRRSLLLLLLALLPELLATTATTAFVELLLLPIEARLLILHRGGTLLLHLLLALLARLDRGIVVSRAIVELRLLPLAAIALLRLPALILPIVELLCRQTLAAGLLRRRCSLIRQRLSARQRVVGLLLLDRRAFAAGP